MTFLDPNSIHVGDLLQGETVLCYEDYNDNQQAVMTMVQSIVRDEVGGNYCTFFRDADGRQHDRRYYWNLHDASNWMQTRMGCDR